MTEKEKAFMNKISAYIVNEAQKEFGFAGLADGDEFKMINTGESGDLIIKIKHQE